MLLIIACEEKFDEPTRRTFRDALAKYRQKKPLKNKAPDLSRFGLSAKFNLGMINKHI